MKLLKAMATVAGLTGLSRVFGFIRDILMAAILGAGPIADAFFVALKLPNFFRRVTAEGAFSASFVPLYSEKLEKDGPGKADDFAANAFAVMLAVLVPFTIVALFAMPWLIYGIAPGFGGEGVRYEAAVELSRITFPYLLLMSLTALLGGVLNARERFAPFATAPILFNLCLIGALLFGADALETPGHALAWGVFAAGLVQLAWLVWHIKRAGITPRMYLPRFNADVKKLFALMGPNVISAGAMHINLLADLIIASWLAPGAISYLFYADRLNQLPLGLVGIAVGTALLPMLSRALAAGDAGKAQNLFNRAMEICLILALPAAVALILVPEELIGALFERGAFTGQDTIVTAQVLMGYAVGLPAYVCAKVFQSAFWARQDTVTPAKISIICTGLNIAMTLVLIQFIGVAGIALATGLAGWAQFFLLQRALGKIEEARYDTRFLSRLPRIILAACLMGAVVYSAAYGLQSLFASDNTLHQVTALCAMVGAGLISYALAILAIRALTFDDFKTYFERK